METTPEQVAEGKALVTVLACVLEKLIQANSNSGHDRLEAEAVTKFHALRPPGIGVAEYLDRILKYSSCSNECFVLGLIYMDRFIQRNDFALTALNVHRVSITSIMVAAKFFDDQYYNNAYYAKVGGVPCAEINSLEIEFLFGLDFNLAVTAEEYGNYRERLSEHANCSTCGCAAGMLVKRQRPSPPLPPSSRLSETGRNDGGSASSGSVAQGSASGWPKPRDGYDELALTAGDLNQARDGPELITPAAVLGNPQSSIARGARGLGGGIVQGNGGGDSALCAPVGKSRGDSGVGAVHRGGFDPDAAAGLERELQQQQAAFRRVQQHQQLQNHHQQQLLLEQETTGAEALLSIGGVIESNFYGGDGRGAPLRTTRQRAAQQQQYYPQQEEEQQQQEHQHQLLHRQTRGKFPAAHSGGASTMDGASGLMPMKEVCSSAIGSVAQGIKQGASTASGNVSITLGSQRFRITPSPEHVHPFQGSSSSGVGLSMATVSGGTGDSGGGAGASGATEPTSSVFGNLSLQRMASAGGVTGSLSSNLCSNGGGSSSSSGFPLPAGHARRGSTGGAVRGLGSGDLSTTLAAAAAATGTAGLGGGVGGGFVGFSGGRGVITGKGEGALCMPSPHGVCVGWGAVGGGGEPLGNILFEKQEQQQQQIPFRSQHQQQQQLQRYRSGQKQYQQHQQQQNHLGLSSLQQVHSSFAGGRASASSPAGPPERGHYSAGAYAASPSRYRETAGGGKASRDGLIRDTVVNGNYFGDVGSGMGVGGRLSNHSESEQTTSNLFDHRVSGSVSGSGSGSSSGLDTSGLSAYGRAGGIASNTGEGVGGIVPAWHDIHSGRGHRPRNASASCGNFPLKSVGGGNGGVGLGVGGLIGGHGGFLEQECLEARKCEANGSFVSTPPSVGTKGGGGYLKSTPGSGIGGVGGSGCGAGGRAGRGGSGSMYSPEGGETFFTPQRGGSEGTYGFPHHRAAMLGGSGIGSDGSVYVTPRSTPRHVEGEACIGEDGSSYSHQQYLDPSISYPTSQELARDGEGFDVMGVGLEQGQAARTGFRGAAAPGGGAQGTSAGWPLDTGRETWSC